MTHDCDRATELLEQVKRKRDVDAMVAALLQKNARGCHCYQAGYLNGQQADVGSGRLSAARWRREPPGTRYTRFLFWPESSSRAWPGLKRWSSQVDSFSPASRASRARAGA